MQPHRGMPVTRAYLKRVDNADNGLVYRNMWKFWDYDNIAKQLYPREFETVGRAVAANLDERFGTK